MEFNTKHLTINFTTEYEADENVNFLDLTIQRKHDKLNYTIYRRPTSTDIFIHNSSCHPYQHKVACVGYLTNRLYSYPVSIQATDTQLGIIKTIDTNIHTFTQDIKTRTKNTKETKTTIKNGSYLQIQNEK
jgi:hypothetical protein